MEVLEQQLTAIKDSQSRQRPSSNAPTRILLSTSSLTSLVELSSSMRSSGRVPQSSVTTPSEPTPRTLAVTSATLLETRPPNVKADSNRAQGGNGTEAQPSRVHSRSTLTRGIQRQQSLSAERPPRDTSPSPNQVQGRQSEVSKELMPQNHEDSNSEVLINVKYGSLTTSRGRSKPLKLPLCLASPTLGTITVSVTLCPTLRHDYMSYGTARDHNIEVFAVHEEKLTQYGIKQGQRAQVLGLTEPLRMNGIGEDLTWKASVRFVVLNSFKHYVILGSIF